MFFITYSRSDVVATEFKFEKPIQGAVDPLGSQEVPGYLPGISDQDAKVSHLSLLSPLIYIL